ncbi:MAG: TVP38/TMEM64 family protein [Chloroflexi bacterium]|nr:TVP38/TMEM64 family protein [Chloroflexota bacterium]
MYRYWLIVAILIAAFLSAFLVVEQLHPALLTDPNTVMKPGSIGAAFAGIGLLWLDVALPVPSSLIMIANGALFGIFLGSVLSLIGGTGAAVIAFYIGRRGGPLLKRFVPAAEYDRANRFLDEWGVLAIIVTRPVPLLAETTAIMAGSSNMGLIRVFVASIAGLLPVSLLYAVAGATAASFGNAALSFVFVLIIAAVFWMTRRRLSAAINSRFGPQTNAQADAEAGD